MNRRYIKQLLTLSLASTLLFSGTVHAKIVCWTNNEGIRECGNTVPPEYAQKETRTLNERGRTTDIKERAKTAEEITAEKAQRAEEKRLANEEAERQRKQDAYDRVLLATYLVENDIIRSRDRQSGSIDATVEITNITVDKLQNKLNANRKKAADLERKGKKLPKRLQQDISSLQEQIDEKKRFIHSKELEKKALHEKYAADMVRFRELKADGIKLR